MSEDYYATLRGGQDIYIPSWSAKIQYKNMMQACKYLGEANVVAISTLDIPAAVVAMMGSDDPDNTTDLVLHFIQQARIDGEKIDNSKYEELGMTLIAELFTHVIHSQYADFFASGLAKEPSQSS